MTVKRVLVFISAPHDVQYALSLYLKFRGTHQVSFYIVFKPAYRFLSEMGLDDLSLTFIYEPSLPVLKNPIRLFFEKVRISRWGRRFGEIEGAEVYFFNDHWTWMEFGFLDILSQSNQLILSDYRKTSFPFSPIMGKTNFKTKILFWVYQFLSPCHSEKEWFTERYPCLKYRLPSGTKSVATDLEPSVFTQFLHQIPPESQGSVLFLDDSNAGIKDALGVMDYPSVTAHFIMTMVSKGINVYIKPHPRVGMSSDWSEVEGVSLIPDYVPAEFIDLSQFSCVVSYTSSALCAMAKRRGIPCYSSVELYSHISAKAKAIVVAYIEKESEKNVVIVKSLPALVVAVQKLIK
jgi:hypothetical protein